MKTQQIDRPPIGADGCPQLIVWAGRPGRTETPDFPKSFQATGKRRGPEFARGADRTGHRVMAVKCPYFRRGLSIQSQKSFGLFTTRRFDSPLRSVRLAGVNATSARVDTRAVRSDTITGCGSLVRAKLLEMWSEIRSVTVDAISQPLTVRRHSVNGPVSSLAILGMSIQMPRNPTAAKTKEIAMIQRIVAGLVRGAGAAFR
jgi:hypothetical protein